MDRKSYHVFKIGGSALTQPASYAQVADALLSLRKSPLVVVVSAMAGITNQLIQTAQSSGIYSRKYIDEIVAYGEIISTKIMTLTFKSKNVKAIGITPLDDEWPIITNSDFGDAMPILECCTQNLASQFRKMKGVDIVVLSGFLGRDAEGNITTLGRGGSDTTAVLIGHCMGWQVHIIKTTAALETFRENIAAGSKKDSITVDELKEFLVKNPGFVADKALKYIGPKDSVRISVLSESFDGITIRSPIKEKIHRRHYVIKTEAIDTDATG